MLLASTARAGGKPVVLAFGVTRSKGQFAAEVVYVAPTVGVDKEHTPIPAGPLNVEWFTSAETEGEQFTIDWPGLTTGVAASARVHYDTIFIIPEETQ